MYNEIAEFDLRKSIDRVGDRSLKTKKLQVLGLIAVIALSGLVFSLLVAHVLGSTPSKSKGEIRDNAFASIQTVPGYTIVVTNN